jgi:tetratricopeptide (TPR) repeat protein
MIQKQVLAILLLLLCSLTSWAQGDEDYDIVDLKQEYQKAVSLFNQGMYKEVIPILSELIPAVAEVYEDTNSFWNMENMLGIAYYETGQEQEGLAHLQKTYDFYAKRVDRCTQRNFFNATIYVSEIAQNRKQFKEASQYIETGLTCMRSSGSQKSPEYVALLTNFANCQYALGNKQRVDSSYKAILTIEESLYGKGSLHYARMAQKYADYLLAERRGTEAEPYLLAAKPVFADSVGKNSAPYIHCLQSLALVKRQQFKYTEAETSLVEIKQILESTGQKNSREYARCLFQLGSLHKALARYPEAEVELVMASAWYESRAGGIEDDEYLIIQSNLAALYQQTGRYTQAELLYLKDLEVYRKNKARNLEAYATVANNLGLLYDELGRFDEAEVLLTEALSITAQLSGTQSAAYAITLSNLGMHFRYKAQYPKAEEYLVQVVNLQKTISGENSLPYGNALNNLAALYQVLGRLGQAEPLYQKAVQIAKVQYGPQHPDYARAINNLASVYQEEKKTSLAVPLYEESLGIIRATLGVDHPEYARVLNNVALLYIQNGDYVKAETTYKQDLTIIKTKYGEGHPQYATTLSNLANSYEHQGNYVEAEKAYLQVLVNRKSSLGTAHPDYTKTLGQLARVSAAQKKNAAALGYWKEVIENYKRDIERYFPSMSENEKGQFYNTLQDRFEQFNSFASEVYTQFPEVLAMMFDTQLATKAILFNSSFKIREAIMASGNAALIAEFNDWQLSKQRLAQQLMLGAKATMSVDSLSQRINALDKSLSLKSSAFEGSQSDLTHTWQEVQKRLKPTEAAAEIIRFRKYKSDKGGTYVKYQFEGKEEMDSVYYAVLIVTAETVAQPKVVWLKNGTDMERKYIKLYSNTIIFKLEDPKGYENYWKPLRPYLQGISTLYLSPDGVYNQINLITLKNPETQKEVIDEIEIIMVSNSRELLLDLPPVNAPTHIFLLGDPEFALPNAQVDQERNSRLKKLPGTAVEVHQIGTQFTQNNWQVEEYLGVQSTEEHIKNMKQVRVVHIATHGFFSPDVEANEFQYSEANSPLFRSGLYLAGAGNKDPGQEDGVLTAYEALSLPLDNTDLVVMSACETGLGKVKNGEGVYGLQRALRVAGARHLIISLWKVDDVTTQKLMSSFYANWMKTNDLRKAFRMAQEELRKEHPEAYYWGAFVLVGR